MKRKVQAAYQRMVELIEMGWEYPNAHTDACLFYNLTLKDGEQVARMYDAN